MIKVAIELHSVEHLGFSTEKRADVSHQKLLQRKCVLELHNALWLDFVQAGS